MVDPLPDAPLTGAPLAEGTLILDGRFRIGALLGGGGMGLVYAAEQVSLGRKVAVKVLRDDVPVAQVGERFRREAQLMSQVEHPAVVRVIDFGPLGDSMCLVLEFVEGETLESVLQRDGALSVERAEVIFSQLAQGLSAIHARGIVHRDLKPDNVVLTQGREGQGPQARLLDFGIARLMEVEPTNAPTGPRTPSSVTQQGLVVGTPAYMSPEQALGQPVDARSDLYALGLIAFVMLTGRHPFPGPGPRDYFAQHITTPPPSVLDLAAHLKAFPALVATVQACLAKDPAARPQTAAQLVEMLGRKPLQLRREAAVSARRPPVVALGLGAVAVVGAVIGVTAWRSEPARHARRLIEANRGAEALQVLDDVRDAGTSWALQQLQAVALHQVARHEEEWKVLAQVPSAEPLEPLALEGLADDFGHSETVKLRKLLAGFQKPALPALQALAKSDQRFAQWGALRFVDLEYAGQGLPLFELYVRALTSRDCTTRKVAARRLIELRNPEAIDSLKALKDTPKVKNEDCGQEAAAQAIARLAKEAPEP